MWLYWLFIVAWAYMYNAIIIFLRCSFPVQTSSNVWVWFIFDYMCDAIYIMDMVLRSRLIFFQGGDVIVSVGLCFKRIVHEKKIDHSVSNLEVYFLIGPTRSSSTRGYQKVLEITQK